jgi:hypothetical protein
MTKHECRMPKERLNEVAKPIPSASSGAAADRLDEQALVAPYQLGTRAIKMQASNHRVNKSRGSEVEPLEF